MAVLLARGQITIAAIKDGAPGPQGKPGKDAVSIIVEDAPLVFDTDDSGIVPVSISKVAKVKIMKGNLNISNECSNINSRDDLCVNCKCGATQKDGYIEVSVSGSNIAKNDVVIDGINQGQISATSGYAVAQFVYTGVLYFAQVPFSVNVSKYMGSVKVTAKQYQSQFKALENDLKGSNPTVLKAYTSTIKQTAREISLSVSEKSVGRRNMLVGSACRKYGDGFMYMNGGYYDGYPLEQIEKNSGIDGVNCIHCRTKQAGTTVYYLSGFRWSGFSPQGNIKLQRGKNYVLSFYAKTHTPNDIYFLAEVLYQGSKIDTSRPAGYAGPTGYSTTFPASEADKWKLFTVKVSVPPDALYEYVEINIFARARSYSFVSGYICKPMLEEGENYNGWTLSEQDYDYVGGNLLDNARTLDKSGTLVAINDTVIQNGYGTDSACIKNLIKANATLSDYKEVLRWIFGSTYLVNGNDYIFSFVAKADMDDARVVCYMWSGDKENSCNIFTEGNGGAWDSNVDGNIVFILSRQWTRYWVHWRPKDGYATPKEVIIRHTGNNSTSASTVYVTQPKLEIGATMTEWTERKTDLVDKASLKKAGIGITDKEVLLYGEQVKVKNNGKTAAMFKDGKLNAELIDADTINVHHVWAKDSNNQNTLAHFGNYDIDEAKDEDGKQYPLWVGSSTVADSPFRVSKDGYMYADKGAFGVRYYEDEDSGTRKKFGRFEITGEGLSSGAVFKEDSMMLTDTRFQLIKAEGRSAIFIDTDQTLAVPGPGTYLSAKMRVDAIDTTDGYHSNVCYFAEAKNGVQNYALRGIGDVSVNGGVYGYKYTMINMTTKNVFLDNTGSFRGTTYNEVQKIDSLTLIVSSKKYLALALPTLGTIKQILFGSKYVDDKFCVRLTIVMDIGSESIAMRGRCTTKDGAYVAQWNTKDFPLITHWNGDYWADFDMAAGDSYEFLLTYNPDKSYTLGGFTQPYLARIINRQY
jgi:hypothetical protein